MEWKPGCSAADWNSSPRTCAELFVDGVAEAFRVKSVRIAESLKLALFYRPVRSRTGNRKPVQTVDAKRTETL
jgi:hypothetical protein